LFTTNEQDSRELRWIEKQLAELTQRIWRIEKRLGISDEVFLNERSLEESRLEPDTSRPKTVPASEASVSSKIPERPLFETLPEPIPPSPSPISISEPTYPERSHAPSPISAEANARSRFEWEALVGGKWTLWVGSLAVFLAVSYFLKLAWNDISPVGRVGIGFLGGLLFLSGGLAARTRGERWFSEGLMGSGLAIFYLSTWGGVSYYHIFLPLSGMVMMEAITALGVGLSLWLDAQGLIILATLGGFLTPVLLQSGGNTLALFYYVTLLDLGILAVSLFKGWRSVSWLSFVSTILLVSGRALSVWTENERTLYFAFSSIYFLMFLFVSSFHSLLQNEETESADLLLFFADTFVYAVLGYKIVTPLLGEHPALFPVALSLFFGLVTLLVHLAVPRNRNLKLISLGSALFFITIAVPIELKQTWIAVGWSIEAAILLTVGIAVKSHIFKGAAHIVWWISLFALLIKVPFVEPMQHMLFVNERALPLLISVLATAWMALFTALRKENKLQKMYTVYVFYPVVLGGWLLAQETFLEFSWVKAPTPETWEAGAIFFIAALLAIYSVVIFALGMFCKESVLRLAALTVITFAILLPVVNQESTTGWRPFLNLRWFSYVTGVLSLFAIAWMLKKEKSILDESEEKLSMPMLIAMLLFALWGMSVELYETFSWMEFPSVESWKDGAFFAIAALCGLYAAIIAHLGFVWKEKAIRGFAICVEIVAVMLVLFLALSAADSGWGPALNLRFFAFGIVTVSLAYLAMLAKGSETSDFSLKMVPVFAAIILGIWGLTQETYESFYFYRAHFGDHWNRAAQMGVSLVWTLCASGLLVEGMWKRHPSIRFFSLGFFGIIIIKVFFFDLSFLDTSYKILSFGGLGVALIVISWLYSRYGRKMFT